jgi:hypothetical protein
MDKRTIIHVVRIFRGGDDRPFAASRLPARVASREDLHCGIRLLDIRPGRDLSTGSTGSTMNQKASTSSIAFLSALSDGSSAIFC